MHPAFDSPVRNKRRAAYQQGKHSLLQCHLNVIPPALGPQLSNADGKKRGDSGRAIAETHWLACAAR